MANHTVWHGVLNAVKFHSRSGMLQLTDGPTHSSSPFRPYPLLRVDETHSRLRGTDHPTQGTHYPRFVCRIANCGGDERDGDFRRRVL